MKLAEVRPRKQNKDNTLEDFFNKRLREFKRKILDVLTNIGVPDEVLMKVPFVPTGELSEPSLPDRENWVTALYMWISAFKRINNNAKAAFLLANGHRFIEPPSNRAPDIENMNEKHSEQMQASKTEF